MGTPDSGPVALRPMTAEEDVVYRERSVPLYAAELVRSRGMAEDVARQTSGETFAPTPLTTED